MLSATNNFSDGNFITEGRLGKVYKGQHLQYVNLVNFSVRRLDREYGQGDEFETEISMLTSFQQKNIVSFFWLCDEDNEKIG
ncbi:putative non-specific serine/threonine protein kinase [Helianthus anomalus]